MREWGVAASCARLVDYFWKGFFRLLFRLGPAVCARILSGENGVFQRFGGYSARYRAAVGVAIRVAMGATDRVVIRDGVRA